MKPEHKRYILENINKKPVKKIAQELNLKERNIRKFLEKEGKEKKEIGLRKEAKTPIKKQTIFISIILIIILGFTVYSNSLNGEFIWDDEFLVKDNAYIKSWSRISNIFTKNIAASVGKQSSFYRPLQIFTYAIDYFLWRLNVKGYHLTNILLHILVALSIYWLINILYDNRLLSLFTSILFVACPIHTEAVAYISGRADSLALVFMLTCFILYIKHLHSNSKVTYILMLLSYILAILSRENSLILPALLLLYHYTFKKRLEIKRFLPVVSITTIYILLRITVLKSMLSPISYDTTLFQRIPGFFVAITNYMKLLFLPFGLHMEYGNSLFNFTNPKAILGIVILLSLLVYALRKRNTNNLIFFSISWFFITLLVQSNLYPINAYMAEHWLYLPSIGFFLILANGLSSLYRRKESRILTICLIAGLLTFYSYLTIRQNSYWREPVTFYKRTLKYAPDSSRIYNNLGNAYNDIGKSEKAIPLFKKAIAINPNFAEAYSNLGNADTDIGKSEEAIASYKKAIELNPNYADAYNNLGNIYRDIGKNEEAITLYKKAIAINSDYAEAYYNLGNTYHDIDKKEAIVLYKKAISINPNHAESYNNLGNIYHDIDKKEAIILYKKAIAINPNHAEAYNNLGSTYCDIGKKKEAIVLYKKAIEINPNYAEAYTNLGNIYLDIGKKEEAIVLYKKAIEINSDYAEAYYNLGNTYRSLGKHEEALDLYKKAIKVNPNYVEAYNNLGIAYYDIGRKEDAVALFKRAMKINPNYAEAYNNLAIIYYNKKQYSLAVKHCNRAIELGYKVNPEFLKLLEPYRK